jgi:succinate-semialdehyde dehydrogenase
MGVYEDKVKKNRNKARILWSSLKDKKTVGVIERDPESGIVKIAKPMGVVGSVTPCTNPIVTPMCNGMFAVKGRNAVIFAPHPRAVKSMAAFVAAVRKAWQGLSLPENLIQFISDPSVEATISLMKQVNIVVATGGMGMVKSAYSSGKPAYGVGAGNVQCILDREINIDEAVEKIIEGRRFDNGIICSGEQAVMVPRDQAAAVVQSFTRQGGFYITDGQMRQRLLDTVFVDGIMNRECVGISAVGIGRKAGIPVPAETKVIVIQADGAEEKSLIRKEKMCPVMALFTYETFSEAVGIARTNLEMEGKGHSVSIHSSNLQHIEELGLALPVSRVIVNQICSTSSGGSFYNGFAPTTTLGCGTWGNNIISENLDYKHLINITRIGLPPRKVNVPTDEELWS